MKRYYNPTTHEWYTEGTSLTRKIDNGIFSGIPNIEQLIEWGFEEYTEPEPGPEVLLERAKSNKIMDLEAYDFSDAVNSFSINGEDMWLDAQTRQQLRTSLEAYKTAGADNVTKWFNGVKYEFPLSTWEQMLTALEIYAAEALNVTEQHKFNIQQLETIDAVTEYDFTTGYPTKLVF